MKKLFTGITLALSALVATSAFASPPSHGYYKDAPKHAPQWDKKSAPHWKDDRRHDNRSDRGLSPTRDWRVGQQLPRAYAHSAYRISSYDSRHLPRSNKNQQWYKVKGDYVLVNERNNKIVRILR